MNSRMTQPEVWTVGKLLSWTTDYLKKNGSDSPRLDAEVLLANAMNCKRIELYTAFEAVPDDVVKASFREMVKRRAEGTPVAYLVGFKEFYSLPFYVNSDCLIPRPETEHLVVAALDLAKLRLAANGNSLKIVDVCTGSGCIAVAVAKQFSKASLLAIDVDNGALEVTRRNVERHELDGRIEIRQGDLLSELPAEPTFDLILSNPPYVSESEYQALDRSVREFEPRIALVAGETGTELIQLLESQAHVRLLSGGSLLIELSPMIAQAVKSMFSDESRWTNVKLVRDLAGHHRVLQATKV